MMKKSLLFSVLCAVMLLMGCEKKTDPQPFDDYLKLTLNSSATESKLTKEMLKSATKIKISGSINAADFKILREHQELEYLNLGDANVVGEIIVGYDFNEKTEKYEPLTVEGNAIPYGAFGSYVNYNTEVALPGSGIDDSYYNDFTGKGKQIRPSQERLDAIEQVEAHKRIKSIVFPKNITHIGRNAFDKCLTLTEPLQFPSSLMVIMDYAFRSCSNLTGELKFPEELQVIGNGSFAKCTYITGTITIPKNITTIFEMAFLGCSNITKLDIHDQVEIIGSSAFATMSKLTLLRLPESLILIDFSAFAGCSSLKGDLTLPEGFSKIMDRVFFNCANLDGTLTLNAELKTVQAYAFHGANFKTIIAKWDSNDNPIPDGWKSDSGFWFPPNFETSAGKPEYVIYIPEGELEYYTVNFPAAEGEDAFYNFKEGTPPKE